MFEYYQIDTLIKGSNSVWLDLFLTIIGTLLGFIGALHLNKLSDRKLLKKEEIKKIEGYKARLRYLIQLIESSLKIINDQLDNFEKLAKEIAAEPTEQHLLKIVAHNDLKRLQNMDTEEIFHAYHTIVPENEEKSKDYKNIYGCIDYLYLRNSQAIDSTEKHVNFLHRDQLYIAETLTELSNEIYKWIKLLDSKKSNQESLSEYEFLVANHKKYMSLITERANSAAIEEEFLVPFGNELRQSHEAKEYFGELNNLATKAIIKYNNIKENSTSISNELFDIWKEMEKSLNAIEKIKDKLLNYTD